MGLSETSIALFSAPCCFKTSVTGGSQDTVPAALRTSFAFACTVMTLVMFLAAQRRRKLRAKQRKLTRASLCSKFSDDPCFRARGIEAAIEDLRISFS